MADWAEAEIVALLKTGVVDRHGALAVASGPMGEVVLRSTQHLSDADLGAMAVYLKTLGGGPVAEPAPAEPGPAVAQDAHGAALYTDHCASCHGERGEGVAGAYPRLAGNRAVTLPNTANLVQAVVHGGFAPSTAGNPRPFGMPPFALVLSDADVAAVLTHIRNAWGNRAGIVSELDVARQRSIQP